MFLFVSFWFSYCLLYKMQDQTYTQHSKQRRTMDLHAGYDDNSHAVISLRGYLTSSLLLPRHRSEELSQGTFHSALWILWRAVVANSELIVLCLNLYAVLDFFTSTDITLHLFTLNFIFCFIVSNSFSEDPPELFTVSVRFHDPE